MQNRTYMFYSRININALFELCKNVRDTEFLKPLGKRIRELRLHRSIWQSGMDNYAGIGRIERGQLKVSVCHQKKYVILLIPF